MYSGENTFGAAAEAWAAEVATAEAAAAEQDAV